MPYIARQAYEDSKRVLDMDYENYWSKLKVIEDAIKGAVNKGEEGVSVGIDTGLHLDKTILVLKHYGYDVTYSYPQLYINWER